MDSGWHKFQGKRPPAGPPVLLVTVQAGGRVQLNRPAYQALGAPPAVVFYHHPTRQALGIQAAHVGEPDAYPVEKQRHAHRYRVQSKRLLRCLGYPLDGQRLFQPRVEDAMLVIEWAPPAAGVPAAPALPPAESPPGVLGLTPLQARVLALWRAHTPPPAIVAALFTYTPSRGPQKGQEVPVTPGAGIVYQQNLAKVFVLVYEAEALERQQRGATPG